MTLQDIVNQAWNAAKKAALGAALGFSLASAPGFNSAHGQTKMIDPTLIKPFPTTELVKIDPSPIDPTLIYPSPIYPSPIDPTPIGLSGEINYEEGKRIAEITSRSPTNYEDIDGNTSPPLDELKKYNSFEIINGSIHYKAEKLPGYYVHYPQTRRIYYVEREDKTNGEGRTTVALFITDEKGELLFRANEQGEMVRVQSELKTGFGPEEEDESNIPQRQPKKPDIPFFCNLFGCLARNELCSATGMGSLAVLGPIGVALYIRYRRRRSRPK